MRKSELASIQNPYSLYIHIPFCAHRCAYCDFNTYAGQEALIPAYVAALCQEIASVALSAPSPLPVHTIFFGGGTPSLLAPRQFEAVLQTIRDHFDLSGRSQPEITLEANPGACSFASLLRLREIGFNRISFGLQSANPAELCLLERRHDFFDVIQSVKWARQAGFANLNLDLIYGLPEQSLERWQVTVKRAVDLGPQHLSLYALTIEGGAPFARWMKRGLLPISDPDLAAGMYAWAGEYLASAGYVQYEISNWAKNVPPAACDARRALHVASRTSHPRYACKHNLQYWLNLPYLGFGAGAHGCAAKLRVANVLRIKTYLQRMTEYRTSKLEFPRSPATCNIQHINLRTEMQETMLLGLRLTRVGVSDAAFHARFGMGIAEAFPEEIEDLLRLGLVEWVDSPLPVEVGPGVRVDSPLLSGEGPGVRSLRLTPHARLVANQAFVRFVG